LQLQIAGAISCAGDLAQEQAALTVLVASKEVMFFHEA